MIECANVNSLVNWMCVEFTENKFISRVFLRVLKLIGLCVVEMTSDV